MNRTSFFAFIAAGLSAFPLAALAETALAAPAKEPSALANAYMVALIQKCLDNGVLLPDEVQAMTDTELNAALTECANNLPKAQAASAPVVVEQSAPVIRRRKAVVVEEAPTFVEQAPSQVSVGHILSALGEVGNAGPGEISADPLDARIDGLQSGIKEGIETSALTSTEAAILNARLARIQAARANLGDTPASRLIVQRQVNAAVADFNRKVHNNAGIPNPDLFRTFKRKGNATADKNKAGTDRLAAVRERIAKKGLVGPQQTGESRFERLKKRRDAQEAAVAPTKMRCFRAPCGSDAEVKKTDKGTKNVFVQQRIERLKKQKAAGNETASVNKNQQNATVQTRKANGRNILIHRTQKAESAPAKKQTTNVFKRRRIAQH